ncbi:MAG: alpha/beta hydrolase-fold protein [Candidatus Promineifilaceae bacterium]
MIKHIRLLSSLLFGLFWLIGCNDTTDNPLPTSTATVHVQAAPSATASLVASPQPTITPEVTILTLWDVFLMEVNNLAPAERQQRVDNYLATVEATPLTHGDRAVFLWQGEAQSVVLAGDMNGWNLDAAAAFQQIASTDLWYLEAIFHPSARLDYKIVVNGGNWQLDPLNPRTMLGGFGPNSELIMPDYVAPAELSGDAPAGTVTQHRLTSDTLGRARTFYVYTPAQFDPALVYPSLYVHDGTDYLHLIDASLILDRLIAAGEIPPLVVVFIPPLQREVEYRNNAPYVTFLADELLPFVQTEYHTSPDAGQTGTLGASMGGLISVYAAAVRPDVFGLVAGQSGAYSLDDDRVIQLIATRPQPIPVRFHLVVGTYETAVGGNDQEGNLLAANQRLVAVLESQGIVYRYAELPDGHSWGLWQRQLGAALRFLYGQ